MLSNAAETNRSANRRCSKLYCGELVATHQVRVLNWGRSQKTDLKRRFWDASSGRIRTYNPSVNSRTAHSRLALQTQDLDARKVNFPGIWGDFGGTLRGCRCRRVFGADSWVLTAVCLRFAHAVSWVTVWGNFRTRAPSPRIGSTPQPTEPQSLETLVFPIEAARDNRAPSDRI